MCNVYSTIVVEGGIDAEYFLDRMLPYELDAVIKGLENKQKTSWEQTRMIMYVIAQSNSTKDLKPMDILKFNWDEEAETDWDEVKEAREKLKQLKQQEKNGIGFGNEVTS